ncbi:Mpo1-like protein [Lutibacter sp.]
MEDRIKSFKEFYPFYLKQHSNTTCRLLHVIGTTLVLAMVLTSIIHLNPYWLVLVPITGYGFAWVGHFFFEKNKPATFKYPLWSLKSDFKMYFEILSGKISLDASKDT